MSATIGMPIWLLHIVITPRCSKLGGCATLRQSVQPWFAMPSLAWFDNTVTNMTQHLHHIAAKSAWLRHCQHDSAEPSSAWLGNYISLWPSRFGSAIASMTRQHHRQHDSASTSRHSQVTSTASSPVWLNRTVASMTQHLHSFIARMTRQHHR
jgi:hypothetical protein